jgi:hypothetical protein
MIKSSGGPAPLRSQSSTISPTPIAATSGS